MHPILFSIGDFDIHTYGFLGAVGFLVTVAISIWRARQADISSDAVVDVIFWAAIGGVIGARGLWVLQNPELAPGPAQWVNLRMGGLVFYGALLLGVPAALLAMWRKKVPILVLCDAFACALPIGHGISRLGCFFAGCCYGTPTDLPWAVTFGETLADAPLGVALHPTQLYEAGLLFGLAGVVNLVHSRKRHHGASLQAYLGLYAILRFVVEFVRGDATRGYFWESVLGPSLSMSQGLALGFLILVAVAWIPLSKMRFHQDSQPL